MAYYTGSVNSFSELLTAMVNACTANGWLWTNGILSKGIAFVKPTAAASGFQIGIQIVGGTGQSGSSLINPSPQIPRLGPPSATIWAPVTWPSQYHIHIGSNPDEVYVVLNSNVSDFYWLAFGRSTVPMLGTGLWIAGTAGSGNNYGYQGVSINETGGSSVVPYTCPGLFWASSYTDDASRNASIQSTANGSWPSYVPLGAGALAPLVSRYDLAWNRTAVLLPVREYESVAENKRRLLLDAAHSRIVRLGSLEPGQILQLGAEKWRIYPFYRKNSAVPAGGSNHTGTLGMALRYDGS